MRERFVREWADACSESSAMHAAAGDGGRLAHTSQSLLQAHEDKLYRGALIASLSIPWGEAHGDEDLGGYHLVWTRDMVNSATGLLAAGHAGAPLRALIYLSVVQRPDGGFYQNFWISGEPYWQGIQLDEVAFPILLAHRLHRLDALERFDPFPMVRAAAGFLVRNGPATRQERWEEAAGYSPSTLASNIAALTCAAAFFQERGDSATATFVQEYADFLEAHVDEWTVTSQGSLLPGVPRHYIRILPVSMDDVSPDEDPDHGILTLANQAPGAQADVPANQVVDAGFLELVRYGIKPAGSALMEDSLRVVDALLKVDTPYGPAWRRYNHDGYGQREDGGPFVGWGRGRAWPLLAGERGHYELAAGRSAAPYLRALESFAHGAGLLPEQVWDEADRPDLGFRLGGPTGSAMPLMWAHAEYLKLLRSTADGAVFDLVPEVAERYRRPRCQRAGDLEAEPPGPRRTAGRDAAHPGACAVPPDVDHGRVGLAYRHASNGHLPGDQLRRPSHRSGSAQPGPLHVLLDGGRSLGGTQLHRRGRRGLKPVWARQRNARAGSVYYPEEVVRVRPGGELDELVEAARAGDRLAFEQLLERDAPIAYRAALAVLRSPTDAEDALQEATLRAWQRLPQLRDPTGWTAWFRRIAVRAAIDHARRGYHAREVILEPEAAPTADPSAAAAEHITLLIAIGSLPAGRPDHPGPALRG